MVRTENKAWLAEHDENYRTLQAMERRQEWIAFVFEFQKELLLNYRRHLWPDFVIQAPHTPEILTPSDVNRLAREEEEARKRLGLPTPKPPPPEPEPPAWDADALDFFTRAGIIDGAQQDAVNDLVLALKAANIWVKMRALYPFVGGTAASHGENLASSSYQMFWNGPVAHAANGITGTGGAGLTGLNVNTTILGFIAFGCYQRNSAPDDTRTIEGAAYVIHTRFSDNNFYGVAGGAGQLQAPCPDGKGFYVVSRQSTSLWKAYKNGSQAGANQTDTPTALPSAIFGILVAGCLNNLALAFISDGLADAEVAAFNSAVAVYQTALGRNV